MRQLRRRNLLGRPLSRGALYADALLEVGQHSVGEPEQNQNPVQKFIIPHRLSLSLLTLLVFTPVKSTTDQVGERHRSTVSAQVRENQQRAHTAPRRFPWQIKSANAKENAKIPS